MNCNRARAIITANNASDSEMREAQRHIADCQACLTQLDQLARGLLSTLPDEITCADCQEQLDEYYEATRTANALPEFLLPVAHHLARCLSCTMEFQMLRSTLVAWDAGEVAELAHEAKFDLSFLPKQAAKAAPLSIWLQNQSTKVHELFTEIHVRLDAMKAAFEQLPFPLASTAAQPVLLRGEETEVAAQALILPAPAASISIQLIVGPLIASKTVLYLKLRQTENAQPVAHTRLVLYTAERRMLAGSTTDAEGNVIFRDLALGHYIVQIRAEEAYEIQIVLVEK